mmetsp:Transcript_41091/g.132647  ORF Transcript_41091/g.132647 Transcript_41091/m.132647 type:complete len:441 (-) Transcript_41091:496-1818(-)
MEAAGAKKARTCITPPMLAVLQSAFELHGGHPSAAARQSLALQLSMTPKSVQVWFQNRRQKLRAMRTPGSAQMSPAAGPGEASSSEGVLPVCRVSSDAAAAAAAAINSAVEEHRLSQSAFVVPRSSGVGAEAAATPAVAVAGEGVLGVQPCPSPNGGFASRAASLASLAASPGQPLASPERLPAPPLASSLPPWLAQSLAAAPGSAESLLTHGGAVKQLYSASSLTCLASRNVSSLPPHLLVEIANVASAEQELLTLASHLNTRKSQLLASLAAHEAAAPSTASATSAAFAASAASAASAFSAFSAPAAVCAAAEQHPPMHSTLHPSPPPGSLSPPYLSPPCCYGAAPAAAAAPFAGHTALPFPRPPVPNFVARQPAAAAGVPWGEGGAAEAAPACAAQALSGLQLLSSMATHRTTGASGGALESAHHHHASPRVPLEAV